jgi:hypothetical protein
MEMENKVFINALSHNMRYHHAIISVQEDMSMISNCLIEAIKAKIKDPSYLSQAVIQSAAEGIMTSFGL